MEGLVERATLSDGGGWVGGDGLFGVNTMTPRWALIPHQWRPALGRLLRVEVLACDPPPLPPLALIFSRGSGIYACLFRTHCARRAINRSGDGEVQYLMSTVIDFVESWTGEKCSCPSNSQACVCEPLRPPCGEWRR